MNRLSSDRRIKIPRNKLKGEIIIHFGTLNRFADEVGISGNELKRILRGDITPSSRTMYVWSSILGIPIEELWEQDEISSAEVYPVRTEIGIVYI